MRPARSSTFRCLETAGMDISNAEAILKVLQKNLKTFEGYRDALKKRHADVGPGAADDAGTAEDDGGSAESE